MLFRSIYPKLFVGFFARGVTPCFSLYIASIPDKPYYRLCYTDLRVTITSLLFVGAAAGTSSSANPFFLFLTPKTRYCVSAELHRTLRLEVSKAHFCCTAKNATHSVMVLLLLPCWLLFRVLLIKVVLIERWFPTHPLACLSLWLLHAHRSPFLQKR